MQLPEEITYALIVICGAITHAVAQWQIARREKTDFGFVDFCILMLMAGFSGWVSGQLASLFYDNQSLIFLSAGVGAFLGITGLNIIANAVLSVLTNKMKQ